MAPRKRDSDGSGDSPADRAAMTELDESLRKALRAIVNHENIDSAIDLLNGLERQKEDMTTRVALDARKRIFEDREKLRQELERLVEEKTRPEPESGSPEGVIGLTLEYLRRSIPTAALVLAVLAVSVAWLSLSASTERIDVGPLANRLDVLEAEVARVAGRSDDAMNANIPEPSLEGLEKELQAARTTFADLEKRLDRLENRLKRLAASRE